MTTKSAKVKVVTDTYFQKDDDVLAVYDIDYDAATDFTYKLETRKTLCFAIALPYCWPCLPLIVCGICSDIWYKDVKDKIEAQHVAITRDGIKYVVERHKTGCRLDCQDVGKESKTVPFDKITDCDIQEPAGASGPCCCMVQNVLYVVNVDTASGNRSASSGNSDSGPKHELELRGLKNPHQFKKDVWSMKRGEGIENSPNWVGGGAALTVAATAPMAELMEDRVDSTTGAQRLLSSSKTGTESELIILMREQNHLLKKQNQILEDIRNQGTVNQ